MPRLRCFKIRLDYPSPITKEEIERLAEIRRAIELLESQYRKGVHRLQNRAGVGAPIDPDVDQRMLEKVLEIRRTKRPSRLKLLWWMHHGMKPPVKG